MRNWGIVVGLLVCCAVFGQPAPEVQWTRTFGGNADDQGFWLENAPGGGFIIPAVNGSGEHGGPDAWLIKTNPNGDMQWNRQYGGGSFDEIRSVDVIPEVGYIALGTTASFGAGGEDFFLVKTNLEGNVIWTRTYGGIGDEHGRFVRRCEDNGYIMTGYTTSYGEGGRDIWLVKTNVEGDIQWTETYGGDEDEEGYSVRLAGDGYCLAGYTESFGAGDYDVYVLRVSGAGDVIWSRVFGGTEREFAPGLRNTQDGGFIVAGSTNSFSAGWSDGYAIRLNGAGDTLWTRSYGTAIPESFHLPLVMPDGGFVFMGVNQYPPYNMWVIRTNPSGNPIWERTLNAPGMEWTLGGQLAPDGGIIICGSTESFGNGGSDVYLVRLAPDVPPPPEHHFITVNPTGLPYAVVIDNAVNDGEPLLYLIHI